MWGFEEWKKHTSITAIKIRAKETSGGSPGKVRGDIKFN